MTPAGQEVDQTADRIPILVEADPTRPFLARRREPVTAGVACPRGWARPADGWSLVDRSGREVAVQTAVLDWWADGSIRWLLVDFQADIGAERATRYDLWRLTEPRTANAEGRLRVQSLDDGAIAIDTGKATFHVCARGAFPLTCADAEKGSLLDIERSGVFAEDASGHRYSLEIACAAMERVGPVRGVARLDGVLRRLGGDTTLVNVVTRLHFFAGCGVVRVELSVTNPRRARHPHGYWDLGDHGSVYLKDLSVLFGLVHEGAVSCAAEASDRPASTDRPLEIYQDSSGGENWQSINHCNRRGQLPLRFRGYRLVAGSAEGRGLRATPLVSAGEGESQVTITMPHFWQNWPKALEVHDRAIALRLFPRQSSDVHELQGGERKTHVFVVCFGPDPTTDTPLAWCLSPLLARTEVATYAAAGVWTRLAAGTDTTRAEYDFLVDRAVEGPAAFAQKREIIDEFGWRHFGDIYADHEAVNQPGLVSHYNNQYDAIAGFATRFCQTGDRRWWTEMNELAAHVADIDVYHCSRDRAAFNHGLFWHTSHYLPAHTATHRSHSRHMRVSGGGPAAEHNYTTGLMLHYFLTGSERSRQTVEHLAQWVLDMDDGAKSPFRWIDRGETGMASATASIEYHGPGRGAGNSINALLDAHRLTGQHSYLVKADRLVTRCISPSDDPDGLNLLDAERRWSYTVFLQVLGKYLEYRAEKGLVDALYSYARTALIRYAVWMARHEEPYLNHPERLEFPNETWAAQDIRKAAVFEFAACHERDEAQRELFQQRACEFVRYSVSTLLASPTSSLTRPIVLLLAYGFQRPTVGRLDVSFPIGWSQEFRTEGFVPYKRRVLRRLVLLGAFTLISVAAIWWLR
jgi:hypothetical protein